MPNRDALKTGTVAVADPAVATDFSYTTTEDMVVRAVSAKLVTDANAANRQVQFTFEDSSGNVFHRVGAGGNLVASLTHYIQASRVSIAPNTAVEGQLWRVPMPAGDGGGIFVPKGGKIKSSTVAIQAGDQLSKVVIHFERQ